MGVLSAREVHKAYGRGRGRRPILDGVSLDVEPGEMVAILGRSGSGKSTLLHLLGGLDRADSGTLELAGHRIERLPERDLARLRRAHLGFVFQFFHLIPELSGAENALLPTRLPGSNGNGAGRARELTERLGLEAVAGNLPHELSGGEQQRFALVRALVNDPAVVLADEPTGNLDTESGETVLALLRGIADEGRAVVVVTHEDAVTAGADRVLELREGRFTA